MATKKAGRAANGAGTISQKKNGSWELRFMVNGQRKSRCFKTKTEAEKARREITASVDQGTFVDPSKMKLSEWLKVFLNEYCVSSAPSTIHAREVNYNTHIIPVLGEVRIGALRPDQIQKLLNNLQNHGVHGKENLSYNTRLNIFCALSMALKKAVELEYIRKNPCDAVRIPKDTLTENEREITPFSTEELEIFKNKIKDGHHEKLFLFALGTGCRMSECLGLRWSRIDLEKGTVTIDAQLGFQRKAGDPRKLAPTKNKKSRTFRVAPQIIDLLKRIKKEQSEERLKAGSSWQNPEGFVFTNAIGAPVAHNAVEERFHRVMVQTGLKHRFHDLRHTYCVLCLQNGVDPKTVSEALGHASVGFTLDKYGHVSEEMQERLSAAMGQALEKLNF